MIFATLRGSLINVEGHCISDHEMGTIGGTILAKVFEEASPRADAITTP